MFPPLRNLGEPGQNIILLYEKSKSNHRERIYVQTGLSAQSFPYRASCSKRSFTNGPKYLMPRLTSLVTFKKGVMTLKIY